MFPEVASSQSKGSIRSTLENQLAEKNMIKRNVDEERKREKDKMEARVQNYQQESVQAMEKRQLEQVQYRDYLASQMKQKEDNDLRDQEIRGGNDPSYNQNYAGNGPNNAIRQSPYKSKDYGQGNVLKEAALSSLMSK
jgi:hypothetical protein